MHPEPSLPRIASVYGANLTSQATEVELRLLDTTSPEVGLGVSLALTLGRALAGHAEAGQTGGDGAADQAVQPVVVGLGRLERPLVRHPAVADGLPHVSGSAMCWADRSCPIQPTAKALRFRSSLSATRRPLATWPARPYITPAGGKDTFARRLEPKRKAPIRRGAGNRTLPEAPMQRSNARAARSDGCSPSEARNASVTYRARSMQIS